ncbi:LamG-like jellyroll fold domain-containing protein [Mesonia maritima]|uniref:LamG-like jellyroll fold domain-containing protein n=1 Tax=Mesonia maritima TaxID=1793873 RepID=A0ABU1K2M3_9FLAO|nr:LamG-like jellyroll fold domain-containing protein [Mesonia maritima]MDR6299500.1 hypothetical protein [Mesonia maritima]
MKTKLFFLSIMISLYGSLSLYSQTTIPGDSIVYGPMFSPVYNNSVRVWVLTKSNTNTNNSLELSFTNDNSPATEISGTVYNSDTRLGYNLRSYEFTGLTQGDTYTAKLLADNSPVNDRVTSIKNAQNTIDDFEFLSGGCGRIYDLSRCIDQPESTFHFNGSPTMFNKMAEEGSDMMIWLGDATYLLGLQHAMGQCPNGEDDWANKDNAFSRYVFQRNYHDSLTVAMPQLAITDNHDLGPNEFDKNMPTIDEMRDIFMDWWPNPEYKSTPEGQGLYSSYKYKDVEFFLLDNRSYRDGTQQHLGPDQLAWLKNELANSTANFKVLINGTPSFENNCGGRNFCNTSQADELIDYIKQNNINGVISFSADIHEQKFMVRDGDVNYPLIDVLSGNLNSDVGNGNYNINYGTSHILTGVKQTYLRVNVYGDEDDRRMKVEYVGLDGNPYFEEIIHQDMLTSQNSDAHNLALPIDNSVEDTSLYNHTVNASNFTLEEDRNGEANSAIRFSSNTSLEIPSAQSLKLHDKSFSLTYWVKPESLNQNITFLSNEENNKGFSLGVSDLGYFYYLNHSTQEFKVSEFQFSPNKWSFIVWKYDNVKRVLSLYYNGFLIESWNDVASSEESLDAIKIGDNLDGLLDNVNLYARLISDEEILQEAEVVSSRGEVLKMPGSQNMAIEGTMLNPILAEDFTIQFWAKLNADPGNNYKILASNGRINNNTTGLSFEFPDSNKLNIVAGTNTSNWNAISNQGDVWNIGEWNHVTVTATKNGFIKYYLNGEFVAENSFEQYVPNPWGLGIGDSPSYGSDVNAEIDELRIWKRALTPAEIQENMHYPLTGTEADLALYYDFEISTVDTSILFSKGTETYDITLDGGSLIAATSPVCELEDDFKTKVIGQWSKNNTVENNGLAPTNAISSYINNLVIGKNANTETDLVPGDYTDFNYLKGGWQMSPLNLPFASFKINLEDALTDYATILANYQDFYLLKRENLTDDFEIAAQGTLNGNEVSFNNIDVEEGFYYLAWGDTSLSTELKQLNSVKLFPNPTSGNVTIQGLDNSKNISFEVYDVLGRKYNIKSTTKNDTQVSIDLSAALSNNSLLIIKVKQEDRMKIFKVIRSN